MLLSYPPGTTIISAIPKDKTSLMAFCSIKEPSPFPFSAPCTLTLEIHQRPSCKLSMLATEIFPLTTHEMETLLGFDITLSFGIFLFRLIHRSEEHTSELQSQSNLVCRLLLE